MQLSKDAQAECNKLNTTSGKIYDKMDRTSALLKILRDHHTITSQLMTSMDQQTTNVAMKADLAQQETKYQHRLERAIDLVQEVMLVKMNQRLKVYEESHQAKLAKMLKTISELEGKYLDLSVKYTTLQNNQSTVADQDVNKPHPLFPNVDQLEFANAKPDQTPQRSFKSETQRMDQFIIPYKMKVQAMWKGQMTTCWTKQCFRNGNMIQYAATTCTGAQICLHPSDISFNGMMEVTFSAPPNYIIDIPPVTKVQNPYKPEVFQNTTPVPPEDETSYSHNHQDKFPHHNHLYGVHKPHVLAPNAFTYPKYSGARYI